MSPIPSRLVAAVTLFLASCALPAAGNPLISEFMADNNTALLDGDGNASDWIEIHNPTAVPIDLAGWRLRDGADEWVFPEITLAAGGYLVVFASGQATSSYIDAAGSLHTNFKLDADGEALQLVMPDGVTIVSEFAPAFPKQFADVSYGFSVEVARPVQAGSPARYLVPAGAVDVAWTGASAFDDSAWTPAALGLGFNRNATPILGGGGSPTAAYAVPGGTPGSQNFGGALGMDFFVNAPVTIVELGVFDAGSDGIRGSIVAELHARDDKGTENFTDDTSLGVLASAAFTSGSQGTLVGGSRFKPLEAPLTLQPGAYTIVAYGFGSADENGNIGTGGSGWTLEDGGGVISFEGSSRYGNAGQFPAIVDAGPEDRYAAGTFRFLDGADTFLNSDIEAAMHGVNASVFLRVPFQVDDPAQFDSLQLDVAYDDGFIAYLNGVEIARRNAPASPGSDAAATAEAALEESIAITSHLGLLRAGENVLAVHGLNRSGADADFLFSAALTAFGAQAGERYFTIPTPGGANDLSGVVDFVADTQFSVARGFFDAPFQLAITSATPGATIRYTTDGSAPTEVHGEIFGGPITVSRTTVLRAAAFKPGFAATNIDTQSYLFLADVTAQPNNPPGFPTSWKAIGADYAMEDSPADLAAIVGDPAASVAEARGELEQSLLALPTLSIVTDVDHLFDPTRGIYVNPGGRGTPWERPVSVEYLLPDGSDGFQIDAGMRVMGFTSRNLSFAPKLSFRLFFKKLYGDAKLDYPLFADSEVTSFNTLALRANARDQWGYTNTATYIKDQWAKVAQAEMGVPAVHGRFVHLYLNGLYWGIYNPTERPDAAFAEEHLGGAEDDYDAVKFCCPDRAVDGDTAKWDQLLNLSGAGLASAAAYQFVQGNDPDGARNPSFDVLLDVDNLIHYLLNGQYHASIDWPGNYYAIRKRTADSTGYRFFTWDNDLGFPSLSADKTRSDNNQWWTESPGVIDLAIRQNAEYRLRFADIAHRHLFNGGSLTPEMALDRWARIADGIRPALFAESARWGDYRGSVRTVPAHWDPIDRDMRERFFPQRSAVLLGQLRSRGLYPSLDAPVFNRHGGVVEDGFGLQFDAPAAVYFTTDGSDPRLPGGAINPSAQAASGGVAVTRLVVSGAVASAFIPGDGALGLDWTAIDFDDSAWIPGVTGLGYERGSGGTYDPLIGLDVEGTMFGVTESAYLRVPFMVSGAAGFQSLTLKVKYDDGFVAYLNGVELAAANRPAVLAWDSGASASHADGEAVQFVDFDLTAHRGALVEGRNVLAIHGLNLGSNSSDFLIMPELEGMTFGGGTTVPLTATAQVRARSFDGSEWSALNEAQFIVGEAASAANLVVAEIMYHPAEGSAFEYLEVMNISPANTIDLTGAALTEGIAFTFPLGTRLAPGGRLLVVADPASFAARYGAGLPVGGTFSGKLDNDGERLRLVAADGRSTIRDFTYNDAAPWPDSPDGGGTSLVLRSPRSAPDHALAANWRASSPGGNPGASDATQFSGDPAADDDGDGATALLEYALGTSDHVPGSAASGALAVGGSSALEFAIRVNATADDLAMRIEFSADLATWQDASGASELVSQADHGDGTATLNFRLVPVPTQRQFLRARFDR